MDMEREEVEKAARLRVVIGRDSQMPADVLRTERELRATNAPLPPEGATKAFADPIRAAEATTAAAADSFILRSVDCTVLADGLEERRGYFYGITASRPAQRVGYM
jgi:hypothetical protein